MRSKLMQFSNFSRSLQTTSACYRPDKESQIQDLIKEIAIKGQGVLARGNGLSYSDCCVNDGGSIVDTGRLNHLLSFNKSTAVAYCQAGATFADLFLFHPQYIPPVIPGTLWATVAGGIANDVHGKNNPQTGTFGQHIQWLELQIGDKLLRCSPTENAELFFATIGGLGLTGIIRRAAVKLRKAGRFVRVEKEKYTDWSDLLQKMQQGSPHHHYQVAWLDFLTPSRAILSWANPCDATTDAAASFTLPALPFRLIHQWNMKLFNQFYFKRASLLPVVQTLQQFNNPLDSIRNWNHLYGKQGLLQFQAVFEENTALAKLHELKRIINAHQAIPTLAVLKYFTKSGTGLLSFAQPGFTLAIDFINSQQAKAAIIKMNEYITQGGGKIYLAKDLLLTREQFTTQYSKHLQFTDLLARFPAGMSSDLGRRLGLVI